MSEFFPIVIMNARPAAGKSEITNFLEQIPDVERMKTFHIGKMKVIDDFPMLWSWYEDDDLLKDVFQRSRLYTDEEGYFLHKDLWNLLIHRINLEYHKWIRDHDAEHTVVIEFSRGAEHGGYQTAYQHLDTAILSQAACLYVNVSYEESSRKNQQRYNPERPDSILEHGLSEEKLDRLYRDDDWFDFTGADSEYVDVQGYKLPYVVFENYDDVTTVAGPVLHSRLQETLHKLWALWCDYQAL